MIHHYNRQTFIILLLFTVPYLGLTKCHFSSDILVPSPDSSDLFSCGLFQKKSKRALRIFFSENSPGISRHVTLALEIPEKKSFHGESFIRQLAQRGVGGMNEVKVLRFCSFWYFISKITQLATHHRNTKFCTKNQVLLVLSTRKFLKPLFYPIIGEKSDIIKQNLR